MAMEGMGDPYWSETIPEDLLYVISELLELPDLIRFRAVCVSWRRSASTSASSSRPQSLWALAPPFPSHPKNFFSLTENRSYSITLRSRVQCIGSGHGWLVMAEAGQDSAAASKTAKTAAVADVKMSLLQPVAGRDIRLPLFPFKHGGRFFSRCFILGVKAVVCSRAGTSGFTILILNRAQAPPRHGLFDQIAYTSTTEILSWRKIRHASRFVDLECHLGNVYLLSVKNEILMWDFGTGKLCQLGTSLAPPMEDSLLFWGMAVCHLVSSPCGNLLYIKGASWLHPRRVFKVDFDRGKSVAVDSLNGHSLFIGYHTSVCISALDSPHLRKNSVYLTGNFVNPHGGIRDGAMESLDPELLTLLHVPYSVCFMPSLTSHLPN